MSVRELLARLDSRELSEWLALYRIEREERMRAELKARAVAGAHRSIRKG